MDHPQGFGLGCGAAVTQYSVVDIERMRWCIKQFSPAAAIHAAVERELLTYMRNGTAPEELRTYALAALNAQRDPKSSLADLLTLFNRHWDGFAYEEAPTAQAQKDEAEVA